MFLPKEIITLVNVDSIAEVHIGESKSRVFRVSGKSGEKYYLKTSESINVSQEIEREVKILEWLRERKIPAPKKVSLVRNENFIYFLMTALPGHSMAELASELGPKECMRIGAEFLRTLHQLEINHCPFDRSLSTTRKLAHINLNNGLVDESDFDQENLGKSAAELFEEINHETQEDLVFTHGDYCFPNIVCQNNHISGVIDLGRAGIADRYQDIALFLRSFRFNIDEPDLQLFLDSYGLIELVDRNKTSFYKKLDEFF